MQQIHAYTGVPLPLFLEVIDEAEWRSRRSHAAFATRERNGRPLGTAASRSQGGRMSQRWRREFPERYPGVRVPHMITMPELCPELAEFVGIMLGDGSINRRQVSVSLNPHVEVEYAVFVAGLMDRLFNIQPSVHEYRARSQLTVLASSMDLVATLQRLGLPTGNKLANEVKVPAWIFTDIELVRACVRGLMDTDGCVFEHSYKVNGKLYGYVKMAFSSHSPRLLDDMQRMWRALGFRPGTPRADYIWLSRAKEVRAYYEQLVGTHNPYHQRRYDEARQKQKRR